MQPALPDLPGARHSWVDAGGVRLHVAELGDPDAPPLLLVHGWPQHWWTWHKVAPRLAEGRRLVMPDLRGHGWSEDPRRGYEKEQLATDLLNLLDALELDEVGYVGHDWGGFLGWLLAFRAPERVRALLLSSIPHPWPSARDRTNPVRLSAFLYQVPLSTPVVAEFLVRAGVTGRMLRLDGSPETFTDEDIDIYDRVWKTSRGARVTVAMYRTFLLREIVPIMRGRLADERLDIPARLVIGDNDLIAKGARLDGYEENAPQLVVERVPGVGHFLPEERPELLVERAEELFGAPAPARV